MNQSMYLIVLQVIIAITIASCGGSKRNDSTVSSKIVADATAPIDIPQSVSFEERKLWVKTLFLMSYEHPQRRELRDLIAKSVVEEFNNTNEKKPNAKLALFEEALRLHEPSDFSSSMVSMEIVPLAAWVAEYGSARGEEAVVLAALKYLTMAKNDSREYEERYLELLEWSSSVRTTIVDKIQRISSLIDLFTRMMELVPDTNVAHRLAELHLQRFSIIQSVFQEGMQGDYELSDPRQILLHGRSVQNMPTNIIHIFFLTGDIEPARKYLQEPAEKGNISTGYLELIDRISRKEELSDAYLALAGNLVYFDQRAALRAYILAQKADPSNYRISMNIGLLFDEMDCSECATDFYIATVELHPSEDVITKVISLINKSLERMHFAENVEGAKRVIARAEKLVDNALEEYPEEETELRIAAASLLYTMGEIGFDDGRVEDAERLFAKSCKVVSNVPALIKLHDVYFLLNRFESAMSVLEKAEKIDLEGTEGAEYLKAMIFVKKGDVLSAMDQKPAATASYKRALEVLESGDELMESSPSAAVQKGFILHHLGEMDASQAAFRLAIRLNPDRSETYGTLLSFLVVENRLSDAVEIYRLAYNQDRIKSMWKIYYSLWVEGLSIRLGKGSSALAKGYLESVNGDSWQDRLAGYFVGKISLEELKTHAQNLGHRVESDYYGAIIALSQGKKEEAQKMLNAVIESNLLGFFEYKMAKTLLIELSAELK